MISLLEKKQKFKIKKFLSIPQTKFYPLPLTNSYCKDQETEKKIKKLRADIKQIRLALSEIQKELRMIKEYLSILMDFLSENVVIKITLYTNSSTSDRTNSHKQQMCIVSKID